jgi:hypothetical protein
MNQTWGEYNGTVTGFRFKDASTGEHAPMEHEKAEGGPLEKPYYAPAEQDFISAMQGIANRYGKLSDKDDNGIYVGYTSQKDNDVYIEPGGKCRLAAIPSEYVTVRKTVKPSYKENPQ